MIVVLKRQIWKQIGNKQLKFCQGIVEQKKWGNAEYHLHKVGTGGDARDEVKELQKVSIFPPSIQDQGPRESEMAMNGVTMGCWYA